MGMCLILVLSHPMIKPKKGFMAETMNPWVGHWLADPSVIHGVTLRLFGDRLPFGGFWLGENNLQAGPDILSPAEAC